VEEDDGDNTLPVADLTGLDLFSGKSNPDTEGAAHASS